MRIIKLLIKYLQYKIQIPKYCKHEWICILYYVPFEIGDCYEDIHCLKCGQMKHNVKPDYYAKSIAYQVSYPKDEISFLFSE